MNKGFHNLISELLTPLFSLWGKKFEIKVNNPCRVFSASGRVFSASGKIEDINFHTEI